jgi:hypothetical protein
MINKQQSYQIAKSIIPDIDIRGFRITDEAASEKLKKLPKECWYINYSSVPMNHLSCVSLKLVFLFINKFNGDGAVSKVISCVPLSLLKCYLNSVCHTSTGSV